MANVLIASLGESPIVVTAMINALQTLKQVAIEKVIVLYPECHPQIQDSLDLIETHAVCKCIERQGLPFDDANTEFACMQFLKRLILVLDQTCANHETVYLSLAGGRKSMSALMALVTPFYDHIMGLYHLLDRYEGQSGKENFHTLQNLLTDYCLDNPNLAEIMNPPVENLNLIDLPHAHFANAGDLRDVLRAETLEDLPSASVHLEQLKQLRPEEQDFWQTIFQQSDLAAVYEIWLSANAKEQLAEVRGRDFFRYFSPGKLRNPDWADKSGHNGGKHLVWSGTGKPKILFNVAKISAIAERIFWYANPDNANEIVLTELGVEKDNGKYYRVDGSTMLDKQYFAKKTTADYLSQERLTDDVPSEHAVLLSIVGKSPMIVSQAYTLFKMRKVNIDRVAVVFPKGNGDIMNGIRVLDEVFKTKNVPVMQYAVEADDIDSSERCRLFLQRLKEAIQEIKTKEPGSDTRMLLSGGRKGMTALSMLAAQQARITQVYHTLVKDPELEENLDKDGNIDALRKLGSTQKKVERMFLAGYSEETLKNQIVLFRIPVIPLQ